MIKILSAEQIRQADAETIKNEPIDSYDLMERAARACFEWIIDHIKKSYSNKSLRIKIICGTGNNGGDGLVIARYLLEKNYAVEVLILKLGEGTTDFKKNLGKLSKEYYKVVGKNEFSGLNVGSSDIIIDCIFGTGLKRPVTGELAKVFKLINHSNAKIISIDLPSGLFADRHSDGAVIKADHVLSFEVPKIAFFLPENAEFVRNTQIIPIGLDSEYIRAIVPTHILIDEDYISKIHIDRRPFDHKGNFGHAALICGEKGKWGATILSARACLRSGVGKLSIFCDQESLPVLQESVPEAMCFTDIKMIGTDMFNALGVGPGMGTSESSKELLKSILSIWDKESVIDADALNCISEHEELWMIVRPNSIITPHPGEFKRLTSKWENDFEKLEFQKQLSKDKSIVTLLKGKFSSISDNYGVIYFNPTGNSGMATAGSGDVLTGIITGLMAQGYNSCDSAILGAWLHGSSGDLAVSDLSEESLIAGDLIKYLPKAFNLLRN